jgi:hypothetical protein
MSCKHARDMSCVTHTLAPPVTHSLAPPTHTCATQVAHFSHKLNLEKELIGRRKPGQCGLVNYH